MSPDPHADAVALGDWEHGRPEGGLWWGGATAAEPVRRCICESEINAAPNQDCPLHGETEVEYLRRKLAEATAELAAWHAECDKVGVPYDPPGFVRHHRGNASVAAGAEAFIAVRRAETEAARLREGLEDARRVLQRPAQPRMERVLDALTDGPREASRDTARVNRALDVIGKALEGKP